MGKVATIAAAGLLAWTGQAAAKDITVQLKTVGASGGLMVFEPAFVAASVGDVVRFVPADPSHNAETIPGMLPAGVAPAKGPMGKELALTLAKPGVYGVECQPHFSMGMIGLIQAGRGPSPNLAAAKAVKLPPLAARRMTPLLAQAR